MRGVEMKKKFSYKNMDKLYNTTIKKTVKSKKKLYDFEINKMQNIESIIRFLNAGYVGHEKYNIFLIFEPKCRLIMSLSVRDKLINHFVARNILEPRLTKYLNNRNTATRKDMGTDYARNLVIKDINGLKCKNKDIYVLKLDISKYFYSIDHEVLKSLLIDKLDNFEYEMVSKIIDSTNREYINKTIDKYKNKVVADIPYYQFGKGLPIGNMTSQFLSIFYLYKLDHYIIHNLHLKHYVRYMDDFIIIDTDKKKLEDAKNVIIGKLENEYKLRVNPKKTIITNIKDGFSFLGLTIKVKDNKTIIRVKRSNIDNVKKRIKEVRYLLDNKKISYESAFASIMTYKYSYKYTDTYKIERIISRYFYGE